MENQQIKINITPEQAKGMYANLMAVQNTKEEFVLDFFMMVSPTGNLVSRIVMSPGHLKRTINALTEQLKKHEALHGSIDESTAPQEPKIGFKSS